MKAMWMNVEIDMESTPSSRALTNTLKRGKFSVRKIKERSMDKIQTDMQSITSLQDADRNVYCHITKFIR